MKLASNKRKCFWSTRAAVVAIGYAASGVTKLAGVRQVKREFAKWGYSRDVRVLIGASELLGAGLLLSRRTAWVGAAGLTMLMGGAVFTHLRHQEPVRALIPLAAMFPLVTIAESSLFNEER